MINVIIKRDRLIEVKLVEEKRFGDEDFSINPGVLELVQGFAVLEIFFLEFWP